MSEFISGFNPNIQNNFVRNSNSDKTENDTQQVANAANETTQNQTTEVSQEATLDFLNQMGNISLAQINMVSSVKNKPLEKMPELINKMLEDLSIEVVKGLTVPETVEKAMLTFEGLVDKATLILNNEFGGIAQFDNLSEADKLALSAQFVLNMFSEN